METTNHPVDACLGNYLDVTSPSDCNMNNATAENPNGFMDSLVFSDEEASDNSCDNVSNNHSNGATIAVSDSTYGTNSNNNENEEQRNNTLRSIDSSEDMERKFEEGNNADGEVGLLWFATLALEELLVEEDEDTFHFWREDASKHNDATVPPSERTETTNGTPNSNEEAGKNNSMAPIMMTSEELKNSSK